MKYIVNVEPKIVKNKQENKEYCNIISTKDSIITRIVASNGVELKEKNDFVKKDEIIISGDITYNEEQKSRVCASGEVYGKTWYTINLSIPRTYEKNIKQSKKRNNITIKYSNKEHTLFKSRLDSYESEKHKIFNIFGIEFYWNTETEVKKEITEYSKEELEILINNQIENKMNKILEGEHKILEQKVLKKRDNDSTIDIDIFIVAEEKISEISYDVINQD